MVKPAIISISCVFVMCSECSMDIPINTPDGPTTDWSLSTLAEYAREKDLAHMPKCPTCGQVVLIKLPKSLPAKP